MTDKLRPGSTECPHCGADLRGEEIPENAREHFGNKTRYSRLIGITIQGQDYTSSWMCPDCEMSDEREWTV